MIYPSPLTVNPPLYLLTGKADCYKCEASQTVIGLAAASRSDVDEEEGRPPGPAVLKYVTDLPAPLLAVMVDRSPRYRMYHSAMAGFDYYMNLCECGATYGDHHLTEQPGGAFMPLYDGDTDGLSAERLLFTDPIQIACGASSCAPGLAEILTAAES